MMAVRRMKEGAVVRKEIKNLSGGRKKGKGR